VILFELNEEQIIAVKQQGHVLLTACPGSGKTRVIIHKLAFELSLLDNNSKRKILALTFTNRAADEIIHRLNTLGINRSSRLWTGTLHSFCFEWIIKPFSSYLPELKNGFSIADEVFCSNIIDELKSKYGINAIEQVLTRFNRDGSLVERRSIYRNLLNEYHKILKQKKYIDFDILLLYSYKLLDQFPKISITLANIFSLICVDEYQDTQDLLYAIIGKIIKAGSGKSNLFLVGDLDQAIYASLGGVAKEKSEIINEIQNENVTSLSLTGNYRSSQKIIDFYSRFQTQKINIKAVGDNVKKQGLISHNTSISFGDIPLEIARLIKISLNKGIPEDEICVLVPQWWLITSITRTLRTLLPDVHFDASGLAPMSRNRENIWYKLSRLFLSEPNPKLYFIRYKWANELIENFIEITNNEFRVEFRDPKKLLRLVNSLKSDKTEGIDYLEDVFNQFCVVVGLNIFAHPELKERKDLYFETVRKRLSDDQFKVPSDIDSFKSYYREMTGITINTCVGVKGEEFETVIAFGLLNGYIPHWNEIFHGDPVVASKKLLYVICSRAKSNLHLISETGRATKRGEALIITPELDGLEYEFDFV
jgi:DNA helicase-2/ATP-dependent DNA helicase PcrA